STKRRAWPFAVPKFLRLTRDRKLPQRDHQPVEVSSNDQSRLVARQAQHRAVLVSQYDRARAGADRDARASSAVDASNIGRPSDVADRTNKIGRCAAEGKTITHSADRERIAPAMKHQRAAAGRAANDKAGLDNVEADAAAGGVGGGGEPG